MRESADAACLKKKRNLMNGGYYDVAQVLSWILYENKAYSIYFIHAKLVRPHDLSRPPTLRPAPPEGNVWAFLKRKSHRECHLESSRDLSEGMVTSLGLKAKRSVSDP